MLSLWTVGALTMALAAACGGSTPPEALRDEADGAEGDDAATLGGSESTRSPVDASLGGDDRLEANPEASPEATLDGEARPQATEDTKVAVPVPEGGGDVDSRDASAADGDSREAGGCATPCGSGLTCCAGRCVYTGNDMDNCGACGNVCPASKPMCNSGHCAVPPCTSTGACGTGTCCGGACCTGAQLCCSNLGSPGSTVLYCRDPVAETCPVPCFTCP